MGGGIHECCMNAAQIQQHWNMDTRSWLIYNLYSHGSKQVGEFLWVYTFIAVAGLVMLEQRSY